MSRAHHIRQTGLRNPSPERYNSHSRTRRWTVRNTDRRALATYRQQNDPRVVADARRGSGGGKSPISLATTGPRRQFVSTPQPPDKFNTRGPEPLAPVPAVSFQKMSRLS